MLRFLNPLLAALALLCVCALDRSFAAAESTTPPIADARERAEVLRRLRPFQSAPLPKGEELSALQQTLEEIPSWEDLVWARILELEPTVDFSQRGSFENIFDRKQSLAAILQALAHVRNQKAVRLIGPLLDSPDQIDHRDGCVVCGTTSSNAALALLEMHSLGFAFVEPPPLQSQQLGDWQKWWHANRASYGPPLVLPSAQNAMPLDTNSAATPRRWPVRESIAAAAAGLSVLLPGLWLLRRRQIAPHRARS